MSQLSASQTYQAAPQNMLYSTIGRKHDTKTDADMPQAN